MYDSAKKKMLRAMSVIKASRRFHRDEDAEHANAEGGLRLQYTRSGALQKKESPTGASEW